MSTLRCQPKKPKPKNEKHPKKRKNHKHHCNHLHLRPPPLVTLCPSFFATFCSAIFITRYAFALFRLVSCNSRTFISLVIHFHSYLHASIAKLFLGFVWDSVLGFSDFSLCCCFYFSRSTLLSFLCESQLFFSGIGFGSGFSFWAGSGIGFDSQRFALVMWFQLIHGRGWLGFSDERRRFGEQV